MSEAATKVVTEIDRLRDVFARQRRASRSDPLPEASRREHDLDALHDLILGNADALASAVSADFGGRSRHETRLLEIFPCLEAIRHARSRVRRWMRPERRPVSLWFQPGRAGVVWQPLGAVGIVVPWNYPIYLSVGPLVSAIAAGNRAMIKMSEFTPATGALLARLISERFEDERVAVFGGDEHVARAFVALPFDHLLFTGSTRTGRSVMAAAAANLTPVTLELGGKSPAIIGGDFPLALACERILFGKLLNAGQTCIAPDYVLLPEERASEFVEHARSFVARCYPTLARNPDYTAIIDERHYRRLRELVADAAAGGATVVEINPAGEALDESGRKIAPTLLTGTTDAMRVMREEIFGPVLPLVGCRDIEQAIAYVNARPRPLALYYFDRDAARIERVVRETVSGGVTINDTMLHIAQDELPFGGAGESGMGQYHGHAGFATFSKQKAVFTQSRLNALPLFRPPFGKRFERLIRMLLR